MKARPLLLALSVLANAGLLAAYLAAPARSPAGNSPSGSIATADPPADPAASVAARPAASVATAAGWAGFSWAAIETNDLDELARRLKAAGFSRAEVRAILFNQIERDGPWSAGAKVPYWRSTQLASPDPKAMEEQAKRVAEQMKLRQKYLGAENYDDPDYLVYTRRRWGNLSLEKLQALDRIETEYQALTIEEFAARRGRPGEVSSARDTYPLIQKERMADIAAVLTPAEFAEFERRASPTADRLRSQLDAFKPTEAEYLAIFDIQKNYNDQLFATRSPEAQRALMEEINAQVKQALGPDRMLDYEASIIGNDQTARLVSRLGLPARVATEVRQAQQDFTQRGQAIRANSALSAAERSAQLTALVQQAEDQLATRLGADGFEAYSDMKGEWLRALKPRTGPGGP
jgi:hypothetical protein